MFSLILTEQNGQYRLYTSLAFKLADLPATIKAMPVVIRTDGRTEVIGADSNFCLQTYLI